MSTPRWLYPHPVSHPCLRMVIALALIAGLIVLTVWSL